MHHVQKLHRVLNSKDHLHVVRDFKVRKSGDQEMPGARVQLQAFRISSCTELRQQQRCRMPKLLGPKPGGSLGEVQDGRPAARRGARLPPAELMVKHLLTSRRKAWLLVNGSLKDAEQTLPRTLWRWVEMQLGRRGA